MILDDFLKEEKVGVKKKSKQKNVEYVKDAVLYKQKDGTIIFLMDVYLSDKQLRQFKNHLKNNDITDYQIVFPLLFNPTSKDLEKDVVKTYANNTVDLKKIIKKGSKVLTFGRALYSITKNNNLNIEGFQDLILYNTYFYSPEYASNIYPVESFFSVLFNDSPESRFFDVQLGFLKEDSPPSKRYLMERERVYIENPNYFLSEHKDSCLTSWDLETRGLDPWGTDAKIICMTISFDGKTGHYLNWDKIDIKILTEFLRNGKQIGANIKFDFRWLAKFGVPIDVLHCYWDTVSISKVINELQFNGLKSDSWLYTKEGGYDRELDQYLEKYSACKKDYSLIPFNILFPYAVDDSRVAYQIFEKQKKTIEKLDKKFPLDNGWSLDRFIRELRMPLINYYLETEFKGIYVNIEEMKSVGSQLKEEIKALKSKIYKSFGVTSTEYDIQSQEQLGKLIQSKGWAIDKEGRAKKGFPLTNVTFLTKWKDEGHIEAELLIELREKLTLFSTFVGQEGCSSIKNYYSCDEFVDLFLDTPQSFDFHDNKDASGFFKYIRYHEEDNSYRIHPTFAVMMTNSGTRNKSYNPNCQNIPSHGAKAELIRRIFKPPSSEHYIASIDYAGLQLRILAIESGDEAMRKAFMEMGGDLHSLTAVNVFARGVKLDDFIENLETNEDYARMRFDSKGVNFGLAFNAAASTFARESIVGNWSIEDARDYIKENNLCKPMDSKFDELDIFHDEDEDQFKYFLIVAEDIREKFFKGYPGLKKYIENCIMFATKNGYVRSPYGMFRRLPYLYLAKTYGKDTEGANGAKIKNCENISVNTIIQNIEGVIVNRWLLNLREAAKELVDKNTYVFTQIHDAGDFYVHENIAEKFFPLCKKIAEKDYPEYGGIPLVVDGSVSNYQKGELWDVRGRSHKWDRYLS